MNKSNNTIISKKELLPKIVFKNNIKIDSCSFIFKH